MLLFIIVYQGFDLQLAARARGLRVVHKLWGGLLKTLPPSKDGESSSNLIPFHSIPSQNWEGVVDWEMGLKRLKMTDVLIC